MKKKAPFRFELYSIEPLDSLSQLKKEWRIRLVSANGRIIWVTSEGYSSRSKAKHAYVLLRKSMKSSNFLEIKP